MGIVLILYTLCIPCNVIIKIVIIKINTHVYFLLYRNKYVNPLPWHGITPRPVQPISALTFDGSGYLFVPMFFNETGISNPNNVIGVRFILRAQSFKRSLIAFMYDQKVGDMGVYLGAMSMELGQVIDPGAVGMEREQGVVDMKWGQGIDCGPWVWMGAGYRLWAVGVDGGRV